MTLLNVGLIGYKFMGRAHSNAWKKAPLFFDLPAQPVLKVVLGPFVKAPNNPVIEKNTAKGGDVTGTGHNSVLFSRDGKEMYAVYHGRTTQTGNERVVFIDRMRIDERGKLEVYGPTTSY